MTTPHHSEPLPPPGKLVAVDESALDAAIGYLLAHASFIRHQREDHRAADRVARHAEALLRRYPITGIVTALPPELPARIDQERYP